MLSGWKTHIVSGMIVLIAVVEGILGMDIPGAEMQGDWMNYVLAAFGLSALRSGVAK